MSDRTSSIAYGRLMHRAMRGLIQNVLSDVAQSGLPGDHHFFITFDTGAAGVALADWLRDRYPEEMTIVIQNWYDGLAVDDDGFSIILNFGDNPEHLRIPFDAIRTFVDPSVEFGLRFESADDGDDAHEPEDEPPPRPGKGQTDAAQTPSQHAEVVRLDSFRKGQ
ncbi:SspB family protein [Roseicyclus sp.]|uniref:SspB family protein n=1 Tax=Roseicyclus sp. TaxID=1914329 RepID=UPI003F6B0EB3